MGISIEPTDDQRHSVVQLNLLAIASPVVDADAGSTHRLFVRVGLLGKHLFRNALVQFTGQVCFAVVVVREVPVAFDTVEHTQARLVGVELRGRLEFLAPGGARRILVALVIIQVACTRTRCARDVCVSRCYPPRRAWCVRFRLDTCPIVSWALPKNSVHLHMALAPHGITCAWSYSFMTFT